MKYLTKSTSAFFIACCVAFLGGCGSSVTHDGTEIRYKADVIAPSALDTSDQTMAQPKEEVNPNIAKLAAVYDEFRCHIEVRDLAMADVERLGIVQH